MIWDNAPSRKKVEPKEAMISGPVKAVADLLEFVGGIKPVTTTTIVPKLINNTAFVLAKREPNGTLTEVYPDTLNASCSGELLADLATAALGTFEMAMAAAHAKKATLALRMVTDEMYDQIIDAEAQRRVRDEERAAIVPPKVKRGRSKKVA